MTDAVRFIEAGFNSEGKSIIIDDREIKPDYPMPVCKEFSIANLYHTEVVPVGFDTEHSGKPYDINLNPGANRFMVCRIPPIDTVIKRLDDPQVQTPEDFVPYGMHKTLSVDYWYVVQGAVTLYMEDDKPCEMMAGDAITMRGAMHAWINYGSETCCLTGIMIGVNEGEGDICHK